MKIGITEREFAQNTVLKCSWKKTTNLIKPVSFNIVLS